MKMAAVTLQTLLCVLSAYISFCISDDTTNTHNAALNKPVLSSSVYEGYEAHLANDGNLDTTALRDGEPSCFQSEREMNPWWAVDLGKPVTVYRAHFTNRADCCDQWANNFIIGLTNVSPKFSRPTLWNYTVCGQYPGSVAAGQTVAVYCQDNLPPFRHVIVQLPSDMSLTFCELQVFERDAATRLDNFVVGLTNKSPLTTAPVFKSSYTVCAQYDDLVSAGEQVAVICSPSSQKYRYVIVHGSRTTDEALCLAEVAVYATSNNLAQHKPASQVSTHGDLVASRATDSRLETEACTQDHHDVRPWWSVDLLAPYNVGRVTVTVGAMAHHLKEFVVGLTKVDPATSDPSFNRTYTLCAQHTGPLAARQKVSIDCAKSAQKFRFVIVQSSITTAQTICIAEVAVYARSVSKSERLASADSPGNLALNKSAVQLSTQSTAGLAVDGLRGSQSCTTQHGRDVRPWWAVDLGQEYRVGHVVITNGREKTKVHAVAQLSAEQLHSRNIRLLITISSLSLCIGLLL